VRIVQLSVIALELLRATYGAGSNSSFRLRITDNFTQLPVSDAEITFRSLGDGSSPAEAVVFHGGSVTIPFSNSAAEFQFEIAAEGYAEHRSARILATNAQPAYEIALERQADFEGQVIAPTGLFASGAQYFLCTDLTEVTLRPDRTFFTRSRAPGVTGNSGRFRLSPDPSGHSILIAHDLGYARRPLAGWTNGMQIRLQPWARVAGQMRINGTIAPSQKIALRAPDNALGRTRMTLLNFDGATDEHGRFAFENVPPGEMILVWKLPAGEGAVAYSHPMAFRADSTKPAIDFDLAGRNITGRIEAPGAMTLHAADYDIIAQIISQPEDVPLELWQPGASAAQAFSARVDGQWALTAPVIPAGEYSLRLTCINRKSQRALELAATIHIPAGVGEADLGAIRVNVVSR